MERGECSTSIPPQPKRRRGNAFDGITPFPCSTTPAVMKKRPFDVFISHRGCDTKNTLASTIYHTLHMNNIHAFLDREELELGDSIPVEIQEAMDTAGVHITIFSPRYAESPWCLAELYFMLQTDTPIIPIFYHVDPSDLRWAAQGNGCYAPAFSKHEEKGRYPSNMLQDWKMALQSISNLSGHVINKNTGDEGMLLETILNSVLRMVKKVPLEVAKHPVGMDKIVQDFERSLKECVENEQGIQIVGIVGLGGSGKTTLATEVYNRKRSSINRSSFLNDVRDAASRNILHTTQKKLLKDVRIQTESFETVKEGKTIIADRLRSLCLLIVLDDVDHEDQLDALLPPKESLGKGSVVIITTRDGNILIKWGVTSIYKAKPLQHLHAEQLFCWHAFSQPYPEKGFEDLVVRFVKSCSGLPLSLKVIGGQLKCKRSREYWDSQVEKIQRILPNEIFGTLKFSYDALDKEEQEIFLDIACFFIGEKRSWAIDIWDASGWSGLCSLEALENKCLVEVDEHELIRMHDQLRDLGRQIAKKHSPKRILFEEAPFRGIADAEDRRVIFKLCWGKTIESAEDRELLRGVLWLEWRYFEGTSIPSWLPLDTIKFLEFYRPECLETLWEDARPPFQLRELRIVDAPMLQSLPRSIGRLQHLKKLFLVGGSSLSSLPEEFGQLELLEHLVLAGCNGLSILFRSIGHHHHLKSLSVTFQWMHLCVEYDDMYNIELDDDSSTLVSQVSSLAEEFCELQLLEHLDLRGCSALSSLPDRFGDLLNLRHLNLKDCKRLKRLPESFKKLIHLKYLNLDGCESLENLDNITNLKAVYFDEQDGEIIDCTHGGQLSLYCSSFYLGRLLPIICQQSELKDLEIKGKYGKSPKIEISQMSSLQNLTIKECLYLYEISNFGGLVSLINLKVEDCERLQKIEGLQHVTSLENLVVKGCNCIQKIEISQMSSLQNLTIKKCRGLYEISNFAGLVSLTNLKVEDCKGLQKIEGLEHLTSLENLVVKGCNCIQKIEISQMSSLQNLTKKECQDLYEISNFAGLVSLTDLKVEDCNCLQKIEGLEHLTSLENLVVKGCNSLKIEGLEYLTSLKNLELLQVYGSRLGLFNLRTSGESCDHFESILDSVTFTGVDVHRMKEWSSTCHEINLSEGAMVCYPVQCESYKCCISIRKGESTRVELYGGEWIVMSVFKEVSCPVEDGGGGLKPLDISCSVEDGKVVVLGGWVMVGKGACNGFKQLLQALIRKTDHGMAWQASHGSSFFRDSSLSSMATARKTPFDLMPFDSDEHAPFDLMPSDSDEHDDCVGESRTSSKTAKDCVGESEVSSKTAKQGEGAIFSAHF